MTRYRFLINKIYTKIYQKVIFLDFQYIDQICDEDLGEIESLNEILNLIEHIPNSVSSENCSENQGTVRFNVIEHTCEIQHKKQKGKGNSNFNQQGSFSECHNVFQFIFAKFR